MSTLIETFPGPTLDATRWNEELDGAGVTANVGIPALGYYPIGVDADGDAANVDSVDKIIVPGQGNFDYHFFYENLDTSLADLVRVLYIGWKSVELQLGGNSKHEVIFMNVTKHPDLRTFAKFTRDMGSTFSGTIITDPGDTSGGLRMIRENFTYRLLRYDPVEGVWEQIDTFSFSDNGLGHLIFGNYVLDDSVDSIPWIMGT